MQTNQRIIETKYLSKSIRIESSFKIYFVFLFFLITALDVLIAYFCIGILPVIRVL